MGQIVTKRTIQLLQFIILSTRFTNSYNLKGQDVDPAPIMSLLLSHGADFNIADRNGMTPLERAFKFNTTNVRELLRSGAKFNLKDIEQLLFKCQVNSTLI
jgi:ankyrin repeat protein